jgi:hypothetical protein
MFKHGLPVLVGLVGGLGETDGIPANRLVVGETLIVSQAA